MGEQGFTEPADDTVQGPDDSLRRCVHCGREFRPNRGVGRPGKYCRRSCRQRAFEQRRHIGDQAWSDARLIRMSEQLAVLEDVVDEVRQIVAELHADVADDHQVDAQGLLERLDAALVVDPG